MTTGAFLSPWLLAKRRDVVFSAGRSLFLWLLLLFLSVGLCATVNASVTYTTQSVEDLSMYQSITFSILSNPLVQDPLITTADELYLIATGDVLDGTCSFTAEANRIFSITSATAGGYSGSVQIPITPDIVTVGLRYVICFRSASTSEVVVVYRSSTTASDASSSMFIYPALYNQYTLGPTTAIPTAGAGPVGLTIPQVTTGEASNRPLNLAFTGRQTVLLVSCPSASECASGASALLVQNCATQGANYLNDVNSQSSDIVPIINLQGQGTSSLTGNFVVPTVPNSAGYTICVPYCSSISCTSPSFSLLAPTLESTLPLVFGSANPSEYSRTPSSPQARENGIITILGEGLSGGSDQITILTSDALSCATASSSGELLPNMILGALEQETTGTATRATFVYEALLSTPITGLVCYYLASTQLWSPVFLNPGTGSEADFTIDVLQPESFTVSPVIPLLGSTLTVTFSGTGLNSDEDLAFLASVTESNPCDLPSDGSGASSNFSCIMSAESGGSTATPVCTVFVNTESDEALQLGVCYQKGGTSNYALLNGTIAVASRTPQYTVNSYPIYAGETVTLVFTGALSTSDIVKLTESGASCDTASEVSSVSLLSSGTLGEYLVTGSANSCVQVCYYLSFSSTWVVSGPTDVDRPCCNSLCNSNNLYIASFPLRYAINVDSASTNGGVGLTVNEVATVELSADESTARLVAEVLAVSLGNLVPIKVKVVRAPDTCVTTFCGSAAACTLSQSNTDYVSELYGPSQLQFNLLVQSSLVNYVICIQVNGVSGLYIPVLPISVSSPTADSFGFTVITQNPVLGKLTPSIWRAWMSQYSASFTGSSLNSATDKVYAFGHGDVPYESSTVVVCPTPQAISAYTPLLGASITASGSSASTTTAIFSSGEDLYTDQQIFLCYIWTSGSVERMTLVSSVSMAAPSPSTYVWEGTVSSGYLAGNPVTLLLSSNTTVLSAASDTLYFYRFLFESNANACFCTPSTCSIGTKLDYLTSDPSETSLTQINASALQFTREVGFDNYGYGAYYITCYTRAGAAPSDTYLGQIYVGMGDPTFYTATVLDGSAVARVGVLVQITAINRCRASNCPALTTSDSLVLAPSGISCASLTDSSDVSAYSSSVGTSTVSGGITFTQNFVFLQSGSYQVCYRSSSASSSGQKYSELPAQIGANSNNFQRQLLDVQSADPSLFTSFPTAPSAGQLLTISMDCSTSQCNSCQTLRIVPGVLANCWETVVNAYLSSSCINTSSYLFPEVYLSAGSYTLCFGSALLMSSRIPGTLEVVAANPSSYAPAEGNGTSILVDQSSDYVIDIMGTSLSSQGDEAFLITSKGLTCHQLRAKSVLMSGVLGQWLLPSVSPYPLAGSTSDIQWLVSNGEKRFGAAMLLNTTYCPGDKQNCSLALCYRRAGGSWSPVLLTADHAIDVVVSDPSVAAFDQYPLVEGMYTMVTVTGTGLQETDTLVIESSACGSNTPLSISVPGLSPVVSADGTTWQVVIRLIGTAQSYAVCYTRSDNNQVVEIVLFTFKSPNGIESTPSDTIMILSSPLYYLLSRDNFTEKNDASGTDIGSLTIYEELQVQATFIAGGSVTQPLTGGDLILNEAECNYPPFYEATGATERLPVVTTLELLQGTTAGSTSAVYQARLYLPNNNTTEYALCLVVNNSVYFRVTQSATPLSGSSGNAEAVAFAVASPSIYEFVPPFPSIGQKVNFTFSSMLSSSNDNLPMLAEGDQVELIDGSLFECGFHNSTLSIAAALTTSSSENSTTVEATASLDLAFVDSVVTKSLTVCYRKVSWGGTFATVPLEISVDRNFLVLPLNPVYWTSFPLEPTILQPLSITFYPLSSTPTPSFRLTSSDVAFLVEISAGEIPTAAERNSLCQSGSPALESAGQSLAISDSTGRTTWSISAMPSQIGTYAVCYRAQQNDMAISYVSSPATLQLYLPESPTGTYTNRGTNSVFQGERFYLFFNTSEPLNVELESTASSNSSATSSKDLVRFSTTIDCSTATSLTSFQSIPPSFGFKELEEYNSDGILVPYLNVVVQADVGLYYVCMKRAGQNVNQTYYDYSVVGGVNSPSTVEVFPSPLQNFSTQPEQPRAWIPDIPVSFIFNSTDVTVPSFVQMFFVPFSGSADDAVSDSREVQYDDCYRPTSSEAESSSTQLVSTSLQVNLLSQTTELPFPSASIYLLCYQFKSSSASDPYFFSSVYPAALTVLSPSPTSYTVPEEVSVGRSFLMHFNATDSIFSPSSTNKAQIYSGSLPNVGEENVAPSCLQGIIPEGGLSTFTSFDAESATYASVSPDLEEEGYYFVCFLPEGQLNMFPVPNSNGGGYYFSVGLFGPQSYIVEPETPYLGSTATLIISGSMLSVDDRVKIVKVTDDSSSSEDLSSLCTPSAPNADTTNTDSSGVAPTPDTSAMRATYEPRINSTGTFILCYQSKVLATSFFYVSPVVSFNVQNAHPTSYLQNPVPSYATAVNQLIVYDTSGLLSGTSNSNIKLVPRSGSSTFDCTEEAVQSPLVGLLSYQGSESTDGTASFALCTTAEVALTVCFRLPVEGSGWGEVPFTSPPPNYDFRSAQIVDSPFQSAPVVVPSSPRPFSTFNVTIVSTDSAVEATFISFALSPQSLCEPDVPYVSPIFYSKIPSAVGAFQVALPTSGSYNVYVGSGTEWSEPNVTLMSVLTVGTCNPCSFSPPYALINTTVSLKFASGTGLTLASSDTMRLIPVSDGPTSIACSNSDGPFGDQTFLPASVGTGGSYTVFSVYTGSVSEVEKFGGSYYACYRRANDDGYAVVSDGSGTAAIFSILPLDESVIGAVACPVSGEIYSLETVTYNLTSSNPSKYPMLQFSASDEFLLVQTATLTDQGCRGITTSSSGGFVSPTSSDVVSPILESFSDTQSNWYATFPLSNTTAYTLCFRLEYINVFFDITGNSEEVLAANPSTYSLIPPVVVSSTTAFSLTISGSGLASTDSVYLVSAAEGNCLETCYLPSNPSNWDGVRIDSISMSTTQVVLTVTNLMTSNSNENVMLRICYRRTNAYLTELGEIYIGEPNPTAYTVNFVPRVGTRPTLTFTGKNLTDKDKIFLVKEGQYCLPSLAVATGSFLDIDTSSGEDAPTWTSFYLPLAVSVGPYTVCYVLSTIGGGVSVGDPLDVQAGGPSEFATSNTPMLGRATVITFPNTTSSPYEEQVGDVAFIACSECSCYDEKEAIVAYGSSSGTATTSSSISIRVGFGELLPYSVCYKVVDSGYALVQPLTLVANSPSSSIVYPYPTYQGQRLVYNFSEFTSEIPLSPSDSVMLVEFDRLCWASAAMDNSDVIISPSTVEAAGSSSVVWNAHIPSVGPQTPSSTLFPLNYTLCYREEGQEEFVAVPFPLNTSRLIQPANPSAYITSPSEVRAGMIGIVVTFDDAQEGDEVYLVAYNKNSNTDCTDPTALIIAPRAAAYPFYSMSMAGDAPVGSETGIFCYIKKGATVAEVSQLLSISSGNPSGYQTNATNPEEIAFRDYLAFNVSGTGLSSEDRVVFVEESCALALSETPENSSLVNPSLESSSSSSPLMSTSLLSRLSDLRFSEDGITLTFVAQFRNMEGGPATPAMHLCYFRENVWVEVGAAFSLQEAEPQAATLYQANMGSLPNTTLRVGQHIQIELSGLSSSWGIQTAAVISGNDSDSQSWCSNFTEEGIQEKNLIVSSSALLDVPVWLLSGSSRLCLLPQLPMPWKDVGETQYAPLLAEVFPPNPSYVEVFPSVPRVGQQVTFTFHLLVEATSRDIVKIIEDIGPNTSSCFSATSLTGFDDRTLFVTVVNSSTTTLTPIDSTDPLGWRSFNTSRVVRICYYSATEEIWGVVGELNTTIENAPLQTSLNIYPRLPQSWELYTGSLVMGQEFQLAFMNDGSSNGNLQPALDRIWGVPESFNCSYDPETSDECPGCFSLPVNISLSNETVVVTETVGTTVVDNFHLCYLLSDATPAVIPGDLMISNASIACSITEEVVIGAQQNVIFQKEENVSVSGDSWRVSFYAAESIMDCQDNYVPEFIPERATQTTVTATTVTYSLEWPVALSDQRYVVCYRHENVVGPVCTCEQLASKSGECYLQTVPGSPSSFVATPYPTYVGESITLALTLLPEYSSYPPTAIKFVNNTNPLLTTCQEDSTFTPSSFELVKVSDTLYTYKFQHDYVLGPSELLVCVLTSRLSQYVRVSSPTEGNVLQIRPFMELTTFPSLAEYIRATQTISLNFTHKSNYTDDVVSLKDEIFVVTDPYYCNESYINAQAPEDIMKLFDIYDTAFDTLPADVNQINSATKSSFSLATFDKAVVGTYYWCYKLFNGTWAPVLPSLDILSAPVETCSLQNTTATTNGGEDSLRAMQYIATTISGDSTFDSLILPGSDVVRVVPANQLCVDNNFTLFESAVANSSSAGSFTTVLFSPVEGSFKVCYRFGGEDSTVSNWSPICSPFTVISPTPTGDSIGCFSVHQAIQVSATQRSSFTFSTTDTFRFISGDQPCLLPSLTPASPSATIDVGNAAQTEAGVSPDVSGDTFDLPYALFREGTSSFRLCYTDASGTQFAVPIQYATKPTASMWTVNGAQPADLLVQKNVEVGQRFFINFTSSGNANLPLTAYGVLPNPFQFAPEFNGTFDGAGLLQLPSGVTYRDGRCIAAATATPTSENPLGLLGVYGPTSRLYTTTAFAPTVAATYITCYRLATCLVADAGSTLTVYPSNPGSTRTDPALPRRGQLITVEFERSILNASVIPLVPGHDRGLKEANLASCWDLSSTAGTVVAGTTQSTHFTTFFPAQPPAQASTTSTLTCYLPTDSSWINVPNGLQDVLPANPTAFVTSPATARADQLLELQFTGESLSNADFVKILSGAVENCSDDALPSKSIDVFDMDGNLIIQGGNSSATEWPILSASSNGVSSSFRFSSSDAGTFSVCYRLKADTVWTLVYSTLSILSRNPSTVVMTPVAVLETELFTLQFTSALNSNGQGTLQATDRVVLYEGGSVNCLQPGDAVSLSASPSDTRNLPNLIDFQLDCGTRGNYTLCYLLTVSTSGGTGAEPTRIPVWGFPSIMAQPDPVSLTVFTSGMRNSTSATLRSMEVISLVFNGFGLVADPEEAKTDQVKLINAFSYPTADDTSCRDADISPDVTLLPLYANGTYSVQQFISSTSTSSTTTSGEYWICYRLNGGQYHIIGSKVTISQDALPSSATSAHTGSSPSSSDNYTYFDGEGIAWSVYSNSGCDNVESNYLFYSANGCGNVPYFVGDISSTAAQYFSLGYASVNCTAGSSTLVRIASASAIQEAFSNATSNAAITSYNLSLCYYYGIPSSEAVDLAASYPSVTLLGDVGSISVTLGTPPSLSKPIATMALTSFNFSLSVDPTPEDYYVLVENPDDCYGATAPSNAALFMIPTVTDGMLSIITAVEAAGTYFICYSHRSDVCQSSDQGCARIVGEIDVSGPSPSSWVGTPNPAYTTDVYQVSLQFSSATNQSSTEGKAWLALVKENSNQSQQTMTDVYAACSRDDGNGNDAVSLAFNSSTAMWRALKPFSVDGQYALCYEGADGQLHFFGPISYAGPIVKASEVRSASWTTSPLVVLTPAVALLSGGGLSTADTVIAVMADALSGSLSDLCSSTSAIQVPANPVTGPIEGGLTATSRTFLFTIEGTYILCYRSASLSSDVSLSYISSLGAFSVLLTSITVTVEGEWHYVGLPVTLLFSGKDLSSADKAALTPIGDTPLDSISVAICDGTSAAYVGLTNISSTGDAGAMTVVPTVSGTHVICFRSSTSTTSSSILSPTVMVYQITATNAVFISQPGCYPSTICTSQPAVQMRDSSGNPSAAQGAVISLSLFDTNNVNVTVSAGLTGADNYFLLDDYTTFQFLSARIKNSGSYYMKASISLPNKMLLVADSTQFMVEVNISITDIATLTCNPENILQSSTSTIACTITPLISSAPSQYDVTVFPGSTTDCQSETTSSIPTSCQFVVTPSTTEITNYLAIYATPASPFSSWPILGSPTFIRLPQMPVASSTLACVAPSYSPPLPSADIIRVSDNLSCEVQGIGIVNGVEKNIVVLPERLRIQYSINSGSTSTEVNIGAYPGDLNGLYAFSIDVDESNAHSIAVSGAVLPVSNSWTSMKGSPTNFVVLGQPTPGASQLECVSASTGSKTYFSPSNVMDCVVSIANAGGSILGVSQDYQVSMPEGGAVISQPSSTTPEDHFPLDLSAPAAPSSSTNESSTVQFVVNVAFVPTLLQVIDEKFSLVYVRKVLSEPSTFNENERASIELEGSGLVLNHSYRISADGGSCAAGSPATPSILNHSLMLTFTVPAGSFFIICYHPFDGDEYEALLSTVFPIVGNSSKWTTTDIVVLAIGVALLVALIVLFAVLVWRLCVVCHQRHRKGDQGVAYVKPHINTRYTQEATVSARENASYSPTLPPLPPQKKVVKRDSSQQRHHKDEHSDSLLLSRSSVEKESSLSSVTQRSDPLQQIRRRHRHKHHPSSASSSSTHVDPMVPLPSPLPPSPIEKPFSVESETKQQHDNGNPNKFGVTSQSSSKPSTPEKQATTATLWSPKESAELSPLSRYNNLQPQPVVSVTPVAPGAALPSLGLPGTIPLPQVSFESARKAPSISAPLLNSQLNGETTETKSSSYSSCVKGVVATAQPMVRSRSLSRNSKNVNK